MIGVDIVDIQRFKIQNIDRYVRKFLSDEEKAVLKSKNQQQQLSYIARCFCAKEAYLKALGSGINQDLNSISVVNDLNGRPYFKNNPKAMLSISHEKHYCIAFVIIER